MQQAHTAVTPDEINDLLEIPEQDSSTPIKTAEAAFIYDFLREKKLSSTLETGLAYAKSASHILAATQSQHIAIDPFQDQYQNLGLQNLEKLGLRDLLTFYPDFSHNVLPELAKQDKRFEFIFIDGDHKFDGILVDFYYADLLLEQEGYILLHDTWMRSTQLVMRFIRKNRADYRQVPTPQKNFALYQKIAEDQRDGMHFREFYTRKKYFFYHFVTWLANGKSNPLKRFLLFLKRIVRG